MQAIERPVDLFIDVTGIEWVGSNYLITTSKNNNNVQEYPDNCPNIRFYWLIIISTICPVNNANVKQFYQLLTSFGLKTNLNRLRQFKSAAVHSMVLHC